MNNKGNKEAFIQFVNGTSHTSSYYPFSPSAFHVSVDTFEVRIGDSDFSQNLLRLRLPDIRADIEFRNHLHWVKSILSPNIMGPLSYWPNLECSHGIVSLSNTASGSISLKGKTISLNEGKG